MSPPHPKAAIKIALSAHSAWLKGGSSGRKGLPAFGLIKRLVYYRFRLVEV